MEDKIINFTDPRTVGNHLLYRLIPTIFGGKLTSFPNQFTYHLYL